MSPLTAYYIARVFFSYILHDYLNLYSWFAIAIKIIKILQNVYYLWELIFYIYTFSIFYEYYIILQMLNNFQKI